MFCPSCGAEIPDGVRFCTSCGSRIAPAAATTTPLAAGSDATVAASGVMRQAPPDVTSQAPLDATMKAQPGVTSQVQPSVTQQVPAAAQQAPSVTQQVPAAAQQTPGATALGAATGATTYSPTTASGATTYSPAPAYGMTQQMPRPQAGQGVQVGTLPTSAYDRLGTDYQTPQTTYEGGGAKPPKKHTALFVLIIVAVLLVAAIVFAVAFPEYLPEPLRNLLPGESQTQQDDSSSSAALASSSDTTTSEDAATSEDTATSEDKTTSEDAPSGNGATTTEGSSEQSPAATGSSGASSGKYDYLVGTWVGTPVSDRVSSCVAANTMVPTITITSVDDTGVATMDIKANFHAHKRDANNSTGGDAYVEFNNVKIVTDGGSFQYKGDVSATYGSDSSFNITVSVDTSGGTTSMTAKIWTSYPESGHAYDNDGGYTDNYLMTRQ